MANSNNQIRRTSIFDASGHREITFQNSQYRCKWYIYKKYESIQIHKINTSLLKKEKAQKLLKIAEINGKPEDIMQAFPFFQAITQSREKGL